MKSSKLFAIAALATLTAVGAYAGEADSSQQFALQFNSTLDRATVQAEARHPLKVDEAGTGITTVTQSNTDRSAVRAAAVAAVRHGTTVQGEVGTM
jgi:hypothetical protein